MPRAVASRLAALACAAALTAGCGSVDAVAELPPAPGPDASPPLAREPAGEVVAVGNAPQGVSVAPGGVAVALREPAEVALLSADGEEQERVPLPGPAEHLVFAGAVLAPVPSADALVRVGLGAIPAPAPHAAAEGGGRRFTISREESTLADLTTEPPRTVPVAAEPEGVAVIDEGRAVAVVSARERVVEVYDAATLERIARLPAGAGPTHVVPGSADRFYVTDTTGDGLLAFRLRPEPQLYRRAALLGAPYGIAVDTERGRLWVTLTATNQVVELTAGTRPARRRTLPSVRQPNSLAVDSRTGRVYVAGRADGVLQLLDP